MRYTMEEMIFKVGTEYNEYTTIEKARESLKDKLDSLWYAMGEYCLRISDINIQFREDEISLTWKEIERE